MPRMALHEELPNQRTTDHHCKQDQPVVLTRIKKTIVIGEHRKNHWQREIGVVHAALLAALAVDGEFGGIVFSAA